MSAKTINLSVPAEAAFARVVRMMAANLAVCCDLGVDEVEDLRMAAEEGFVYSCATKPSMCDITFELTQEQFNIDFSLGEALPQDAGASNPEASLDFVELLLSAVCDDFGVTEDGQTLHLAKSIGQTNAG